MNLNTPPSQPAKDRPLEEPAGGPGLYLPPGLSEESLEDYKYLVLNCRINFKSPVNSHPPSFKSCGAPPRGPYYKALTARSYLLPRMPSKRTCCCPECCRRYGSSGEEAWTAFAIKRRREAQRIRRIREQEEEQARLRRIMLADGIASDDIERDFKRALRSTFLRGGSLPKNAAEYIRRLAHYRASVKLYRAHLAAPFVPLMAARKLAKVAARPLPKAAKAPKQPKVARNVSAKTDAAQAFIGPREALPDATLAISQERKLLMRKIRTTVRLERAALRSDNPLDRSIAFERIVQDVRKDIQASKSKVGDFRFNLSSRLSKSIAAVCPLYDQS